ncbi:saccharopine dehydrogenase-like oxidoreductase [Anthocerotibacter panamensis]|uniref:saccharopine dehydrogenase-like oxidoreductase n=1 Tax=Anthocerotibacter panamensis TaxID=2857077 RepID=UPI001C403D25|nr:saccharopine dehydrogenase-like oxidoreductase [Anthocerotibacter panamensis]
MEVIRVGVLGFGGLGQAAAMVLAPKQQMRLVAVADRGGWAYNPSGLPLAELLSAAKTKGTVAGIPEWGYEDSEGIARVIEQPVDGFFLALPNLPNTFMASVARQFMAAGWRGVLVDAIKRTSAVEQLLTLDEAFQQAGITYLTGCGATPGLLSAAAALASQSFAEVLSVKITFGVGISSWEQYRSTVREDIAHLPGYTVEKARAMTDAEIEALLDSTNGLITLENMEHADDVMLERIGVCPRDRVTVGGVVDTRNPKKPLSTNVQITGRTFEGRTSTHTFTLGDETSMAANVCGPAFGYLKTGISLHSRGIFGLLTSAEVMPGFVH